MPLRDSRLRDDQTEYDDLSASGENTLYKTIGIGLAALAGYGAWKSGLLKMPAKLLQEVAGQAAADGFNQSAATMHGIKRWTNLRHYTPQQAKILNAAYNAPEFSLFRLDRTKGTDASFWKSSFNAVKGVMEGDTAATWQFRRFIQGTVDDVNILKKIIAEETANVPKRKMSYKDTQLYKRFRGLGDFAEVVSREHGGVAEQTYRSKYVEELIKSSSVTEEMKKEQLKRSGYRTATLGDFLEYNKTTHAFEHKEGMEAYLDDDFLDELTKFAKNHKNRIEGKSIIDDSQWKNLKIDDALRIGETGNVLDYRMARRNRQAFQRSLANDFKLPGAGFNPFKTILGWDKVGIEEEFAGYIYGNQISPGLTRRVTKNGEKYTVGDWLDDTFGEGFFQDELGNDYGRGVAIINGKAYTVGTSERGLMENIQQVGEGFKLYDITNADKSIALKASVNAERQMAGLDIGHAFDGTWEEYKEILEQQGIKPTKSMEYRFKSAKKFDMGFQEVRMDYEGREVFLESAGNIDELINKGVKWTSNRKAFRMTGFEYTDFDEMSQAMFDEFGNPQKTARVKNFKTVFFDGSGPEAIGVGNKKKAAPVFYAQKEHYSFKNVMESLKSGNYDEMAESAKRFFGQFFAGREIGNPEMMSRFFTETSGGKFAPWTYLNALSEGIGSSVQQFGLSTASKKNVGSMLSGLLLKRALPIYLLTKVPGIINYISEPFFGNDEETGQPDNLGRWLMRGPVKSIDLKFHHMMDKIGATNVIKKAAEFTPGSDQLNETIPFIYAMGLGQTEEERKDYIENGYDPIRKGRFWGLGNTPWTGTKILYWRPNLYRRVQADVEFSDSKWGSRQEYYSNTWFPNPVNPLAPLNHFIFDRNHYDKKHYWDRPYLQTSPEGANIPVIGPIFSQTVGRVINPPRKMHKEYWENGLQPFPEDEATSPMISTGQYYKPQSMALIMTYVNDDVARMNRQIAESQMLDTRRKYAAVFAAREMTKRTVQDSSGIPLTITNIMPAFNPIGSASGINMSEFAPQGEFTPGLPYRDYDRYDNPYEIYTTPSGGMQIVDVDDKLNLYDVNKDLRKYSINRISGTNQRVDLVTDWQGPDIPIGNDSEYIDNQFITRGVLQQYNTFSDVAGLKGFVSRQFITGEAGVRNKVIEDSSYAYSMNKSFWDQNLGGFGANVSEITRRFVQKRNDNMDYINPIRNTMPDWIPGSNYFTDFKHGDPYSKIMNGEERLPGEGYERLNHLGNVMRMPLDASYVGYSKSNIIRHMLGGDEYQTMAMEDSSDEMTKEHQAILADWADSKFSLATGVKVIDKRNDIYGKYDALIHDRTSKTGLGLVELKTVDAQTLDAIRISGKPLEHHAKQVNYYRWASGNGRSNGYVYYVDKDNPDNGWMAPVEYKKSDVMESLRNVHEARKDIKEGIENRVISRGDLYPLMERYRILADVAPYSQEFADVSAKISSSKLTASQKREAAGIRDRMQKAKEPIRVYPYKFKTSNTQSETVTVTEILDNNTFLTKEYGRHHAIKFAGIHVSESNTDLVDKKKKKYKKDGRIRYKTVGKPKGQEAAKEIMRHIRPGSRIEIEYDADERNKFNNDSTRSIKAVVHGRRGENLNQILLNKDLAKEKENDDSPAAIRARYTRGEIAFGSAMERVTHGVIGNIPFIGSKVLQVQSPYEMYKRREVYGKDFQSWNNPITGIAIPNIERHIGEQGPILGIVLGAFMGSLFGKNKFGAFVGGTIGGSIALTGKLLTAPENLDGDGRRWRPYRRRKQEEINEYVDTLKYVKNIRLYEQYKEKARVEDNFDVEKYEESQEARGALNKARLTELKNFKKRVKLDWKHKDDFEFNYGVPKYATTDMSYEDTIKAINKEMSEIQSDRKVEKAPLNAIKAIQYKQAAKSTMYGYEPGDSLVNIMSALPKKERQYFKYFMDAPEEEKPKILEIAPSYLRRALQSTWGLKVDEKPELEDYFMKHGLPDETWVGWREDVDMQDVKVKIVNKAKADPGEFDIWDDTKRKADETYIPVPKLNVTNTRADSEAKLLSIIGKSGMDYTRITHYNSVDRGVDVDVSYDPFDEVEGMMNNMNYDF